MSRLSKFLLIFFIIIPLCLWGLIVMVGSMLPEKSEVIGLTVPQPKPRPGYELIYPEVYAMGPDKGIFYYISDKRQVVYRYDAERYLELQGENCEGLIWYHDDKNNIHTRIDETFYTKDKLPKFEYYNPGHAYIAVPTQDLTAVMYSLDGGKTFIKGTVPSYSAVSGDEIERFIGIDDKPLTVNFEDIHPKDSSAYNHKITISGNTGYFILKNGDVIFGETVFFNPHSDLKQEYQILRHPIQDESVKLGGMYWEIYHDPAYIERVEASKNIKVEPYQGWDRIRCEIGAEK
ncbi:hypothetical protein A9G09_01475 [Gilliamella sp. wkB292]|uniref:T6SS immunity protein Tli3 family protein n=1 Tax=Gilliamella sp. wkB292 TaxID=3120262 RepID=UPI00080E5D1C|nr:hypothetical protein [Gilliamella apicola]OCG17436.1 hypothetical protein A9G09_01475 [Gilliamella apicola]